MRFLWLCSAIFATTAAAQVTPQNIEQERQLLRQRIARIQSCHSNSQKCENVCERANELESAAEDLMHCAANHDYNDDCSSRAHNARNAADQYQEAVSDADGDCR